MATDNMSTMMSQPSCVPFMAHIGRKDLTKQTKYATAQSIVRCFDLLEEGGRTTDPLLITADDILWLKDEAMRDMQLVTRRYYLAFLKKLLEFCGNNAFDEVDIHWRLDERINVDWLNPEDAKRLLSYSMATVPQRMAIILELTMGLRRIEVIRLTIDKIHSDHIVVIGKGRGGGKPRIVPVSEQFVKLLPSFLSYRQGIILEAIDRNQGEPLNVPDNLYLYRHGKKVGSYSEHGSGFDMKFVVPVREKIKIDYSNHTLRRTFGRQLWKNGVEIETIAKILGHENTKTTLEYIGANLDDMKAAIKRLSFD